jgi:hypothetical protein
MHGDVFEKTTNLKRPVLKDCNGKELFMFESAAVLHFRSGDDELQTVPKFLPSEFPFSSYAGRHSTPLYLGDEDHNFPVMLVGGLLVMASSNIDRAGGRKG